MVEVDQHDDAGFGCDPCESNEPNCNGDRHVEAEPPQQPKAADQCERQGQHDNEGLSEPPEVEIEQQEDDHQGQRYYHLQASLGALEIFELTAPDQVAAGRQLDLLGNRPLRIGDIAAEIPVADVYENI